MVGGKVPSKHLDELSSKSEREQVTVGGHLFPRSPPLTAVGLGTAENGPKSLTGWIVVRGRPSLWKRQPGCHVPRILLGKTKQRGQNDGVKIRVPILYASLELCPGGPVMGPGHSGIPIYDAPWR
jgi:hypothetical protein